MEIFTTAAGRPVLHGQFPRRHAQGAAARRTRSTSASAWKRSTIPIRRTSREFPSTVLKPGEKYEQSTVHKFSVK